MNIPNITSSSSNSNLKVPLFTENHETLNTYTSEKKSNYNPLYFPPDIQMAKNHMKANRVAEEIDITLDGDKCECCNKFINTKQLALCCNLDKLYHLGFCFPLYYHFIKYCIVVITIVLFMSGMFGLFNNYDSDQNEEGVIVNLSFSVLHMDDVNIEWYFWLNLFTIIIIILSFQIFRERQAVITRECDQKIISPSDFTLIIRGLNGLCYTEEEIKIFLKERMRIASDTSTEIEELQIRKVILTYNIEEFAILIEKRYIILTNIRNIRKKKNAETKGEAKHALKINLDKAKKDLEEIENTMIELGKKFKKREYPLSGTILVILNKQKDVKSVVKMWKISWFKRFLSSISPTLMKNFTSLKFKGRLIMIKRAPEPSDIIWENLAFDGWRLFWKKNLTRFYTLLVMIATFISICFLSYLGNYKSDIISNTAITFLIFFINILLALTIRKFSANEREYTYTRYHSDVADKLGLALFLNSCIVLVISKFVYYRLEGNVVEFQEDMVGQMLMIFLSNAFLTPIAALCDPYYLLKLYGQRKIRIQGSLSKCTQAKAHAIWEGIQLDIAQKYANILKTMFLTAFFAPLVPLGIPISLFGLIFAYWIDKFMLLRIHAQPSAMGKAISKKMTNYLELFTFFFALGNFLIALHLYFLDFHYLEFDDIMILLSIIGLVISLIHFVLPMRKIHKRIRSKMSKKSVLSIDDSNYENMISQFQIDYETANPFMQESQQEKESQQQEKESERDNQNPKSRNKIINLRESSILQYAMKKPSLKMEYEIFYGSLKPTYENNYFETQDSNPPQFSNDHSGNVPNENYAIN